MQRLAREELLMRNQQPKEAYESERCIAPVADAKARALHRRAIDLEWKLMMDAIEEDCGYKMI